jgi:hypothetical protein
MLLLLLLQLLLLSQIVNVTRFKHKISFLYFLLNLQLLLFGYVFVHYLYVNL